MNNSWLAYENGLTLLCGYISPDCAEHERFYALRTSLLENVRRINSSGDTVELSLARKNLVMDLNSSVQLATGVSFIELCISSSPMLVYLTSVYKAVYDADSLFSSEEDIWVDQCENIVNFFRKRPLLVDIATDISDTTRNLYHIDQCIAELLERIEDFEKYCPSDRRPAQRPTERSRIKRAEIWEALTQCIEKIKGVIHIFAELVCWHQEVVLSFSLEHSVPLPTFRQELTPSTPPGDRSGEKTYPPPVAQPGVAAQEKQHQMTYRKQEGEDLPGMGHSPSQQTTLVPAGTDNATTQEESADREIHDELLPLLLEVPDIEDFGTRTDLLTGIPNSQSLSRNYSNAYTDISRLIDQLSKHRLRSGKPALVVVIENAIQRVAGMMTGEKLKALCQKITTTFPGTE